MSRPERPGLDLAAALRTDARGAPTFALVDAPITDRPIAAAEQVRAILAAGGAADRGARHFAIAADLITGRLARADAKLAAIPDDERPELERFLAAVWGVGHAPLPPGLDLAEGNEHGIKGGAAIDGIRFFREVMRHQRQAWRVVRADDGVHVGSAAVVNGAWFAADLADRALVLTCAHVCSSGPPSDGQPPPLAPTAAALDWVSDEPETRGPLPVLRAVWESPPGEFDAALLEVAALPDDARAAAAPPTAEPTPSERVYVWGYRQDQPISLSIEDNKISQVDGRYFYYGAFSEGGVSGSPVFYKDTHELIGLHRGEDLATEIRHGVFFQQILRAARRALRA